MTTPNNLDHLQKQAEIFFEYAKAKREGIEVVMECAWYTPGFSILHESEWSKVDESKLDFGRRAYRLIYPEEKMVPKKGDRILIRDYPDDNWHIVIFDHIHEGRIFAKFSHSPHISDFNEWKWPDDPSTEKVEKKDLGYGCISPGTTFVNGKKLVPLEAKDWVGGPWFVRNKVWHDYNYAMVLETSYSGISISKVDSVRFIKYEDLGEWLRSRDCISWSKCEKESEKA